MLRVELNDDFNEKKQDFRAIEAMVQKYSGDNPKDPYTIQKRIDDAESVFDLFNCSDKQKFVNACRLLTGTALLHVRNTKVRNYEQLKDELLTEFSRTHTLNDVFQQLKARHLKSNESVQRYVIEMQEIASHAPVPEADLLECIIDGLNDKSHNIGVLLGARTIRELKPLIDRYEKRRIRASVPLNKSAAKPMPNRSQPEATPKPTNTAAEMVTGEQVRCYNCSQFGHYQSQCQKPKRPENACFKCHQLGHFHQNCPLKQGAIAAAVHSDPSAEQVVEFNANIEKLESYQMVSVVFVERDKCTVSENCVSLFDSGSGRSFVRKSLVPYMSDKKRLTPYRGMGNTRLSTYGQILCKVIFRNQSVTHVFTVIPDDEALVPLLVGRDVLPKLGIHLCQIKKKYKRGVLLNINEQNKNVSLKPEVTGALMSFNLLRNPIRVAVKEYTDPIEEKVLINKHKIDSVSKENEKNKPTILQEVLIETYHINIKCLEVDKLLFVKKWIIAYLHYQN